MGNLRRSIVGWAAVALAAGGVSFGLGALGGFVPPAAVTTAAPAQIEIVGSLLASLPAYDCPGGMQVTAFPLGTRIYVTGRSPDGQWLLTRSPQAGYEPVWVQAASVSVDEFPITLAEFDPVTCDPVVIGVGSGG